ncbi:MAG: DUF4416 family protein [Deltaproteobacteria bacterium]|nr:DUF4416 family protein [Deltaproteobacteria bacterium]
MSHPYEPDPVKLIASLFSPDRVIIGSVIDILAEMIGPVDWISPDILFDRTRYYEREMGWPLYRNFISFRDLMPADHLVKIKLETNTVEQRFLREGNREVNIDPGYISPERLILATGKNYVHRVYLTKGIFADLTLVFKRNSFRSLEWTYPDYSDPQSIGFFNEIRRKYMEKLKEMKRFA